MPEALRSGVLLVMPEEKIGDDVVTVHDLDGRRIALVFVDEQGEAATTTA